VTAGAGSILQWENIEICRGQCLSIVRIDVVNVSGGAGRVLAVGYCKPQPPPPSFLLDLRYLLTRAV